MKLSVLIIAVVAIAACGPGPDNQTKAPDGGPIEVRLADFSLVNEEVFKPRCLRCHSIQQPTLNSYTEVKSVIDSIHQAVVVEKKMPPDGPLSQGQLALLSDWISRGAP